LAIGGLVTGYLGIAMVPLLMMMIAIAIPNFVKARDEAQRQMCINNLRQIKAAKESWALENKKNSGDPVTAADIQLSSLPGVRTCPKGGVYQINPVGEAPTCSVPGHALPK
jgi:type II secretory pathway pseudopilin PulG